MSCGNVLKHDIKRKGRMYAVFSRLLLFFIYLACMFGACLKSFTGVELAHRELRPEQDTIMGALKYRSISRT